MQAAALAGPGSPAMCHLPAAALFLPHICSAWKGSHCEQLLAKALGCREGSAFASPPKGSSWTLPSARPGLRGLLCARGVATAPLAPGPAPSPLPLSSLCLLGSISVSSVTSGCDNRLPSVPMPKQHSSLRENGAGWGTRSGTGMPMTAQDLGLIQERPALLTPY